MTKWQKWIAFSMKAGAILLMLLLFVFYFTVFLPFAVIFRLVADPLRLSRRFASATGGVFIRRARVTETRETAANPY